ncbi:MAG: FadR family transcriptional regulator [Acidobacteriaceae bacterium]|nr:FadR family transcriptional regulator [Acidobacteriaceae bacterium]
MRKEVHGEKASRSLLTMKVVEHVRARIASGKLKPGDQLPPERELAHTLGISRSSLRAGIGFLSAMGVLQSRHGAGTFISNGPPALDSSSFSVLGVLHGFLPEQMFEARIVIESNLAALAAKRATGEHITELAEEVTEMYATLEAPRQFLIHDVRFHRAIASAAGNPVLGALMETVTASFYESRSKTVQNTQDLKETAEMHREIYRAIRSHNPELARRSMEQHLTRANRAQAAEANASAYGVSPQAGIGRAVDALPLTIESQGNFKTRVPDRTDYRRRTSGPAGAAISAGTRWRS